jgi:hypothetical protein
MPAPDPLIQKHIEEAKANYQRYEMMIMQPENVSWAAVFLFYSAIHLIQAMARRDTPLEVPRNHEDRRSYVSRYMPAVAVLYLTMDDVSMDVRYKLKTYEVARVRRIHDTQFKPVRTYLKECQVEWTFPLHPTSPENSETTVA